MGEVTRYIPAGPGMIICAKGGDYVEAADYDRLRDHCDALQARFEIVAEHHANCAVEREELRDDLDRTRLAVEEAPIRCPSGLFVAVLNGKEYAIEPEQLRGLWKSIRAEVRKIGDWSAYRAWEASGAVRDENARLREAVEGILAFRREQLRLTCPGDCPDEPCDHGEPHDEICTMANEALKPYRPAQDKEAQ